jgi:HAD superfamily hydrolase (TIGR01549 family)
MRINAVIFDMDGTLTRPILDFDAIREEMGGVKGPILEAMADMDAEQRSHAESVLLQHERRAAAESQLNPGVHDLFEQLRSDGRVIGLLTRNCIESVTTISRLHDLTFDATITREDDGPLKPDPWPFLELCQRLDVRPETGLMVGDYLFDLLCGRNAGAKTVLLTTYHAYKTFEHEADFVVDHLQELTGVLAELEGI